MQADITREQQRQLLAGMRQTNPGQRFAASKDGAAVGHWSPELGRFYPVYMHAITGQWVFTAGQETLINGEPPYGVDEWEDDGEVQS